MVKTIFSGLLYWCVCTMVFAGETLPYFTADAVANIDKAAVRRDGNALVRQITEELASYKKAAGNDLIPLRRLELLQRGVELLKQELTDEKNPEAICYAAITTEELRVFREYFREFIARAGKPVLPEMIINVTDYGAKGDGVTDNVEPFRKALLRAMQLRGKYACTIKIPDGVFYFADPRMQVPFNTNFLLPAEKGGGLEKFRKTNGYIVIGNQKDLTVSGSGKTELLFDRPIAGVSCIKIGACDNVTLKNFSVDYKKRPFMQGVITEIDPEKGFITVQGDDPLAAMPGMPHFRRGHAYIFSPEGEFLWQYGMLMMSSAEKVGPLAVRYYYLDKKTDKFNPVPSSAGRKILGQLRPGLKLVQVSRVHGGGVQLDFCRFCKVENVTVYASQAMAFLDTNGFADTFSGCTIQRKSGRMISTNGDGFHISGSLFGCAVVNCRGEYLYDDGLNTYSRHALVEKQLPAGEFRVSDTLPFPSALLGVVNQDTGQIKTLARCNTKSGYKLSLIPAVPLLTREMVKSGKGNGRQLADSLVCFSRTGVGFVALNTHFEHQHGKGFMIQSPHSMVENCSADNPEQAGFHIGSLGNWGEYSMPRNVIFRNNRSRGGKHGLMFFYMIPGNIFANCAPLRNIIMADNDLQNCRSGQIILNKNTAALEKR